MTVPTIHLSIRVDEQRGSSGEYLVIHADLVQTRDADQAAPDAWPFVLDPAVRITIQRGGENVPDRAYGFDRVALRDGPCSIELRAIERALPFARRVEKRWREALRVLDPRSCSVAAVAFALLATFPKARTYFGLLPASRERLRSEVLIAEERWQNGGIRS